MSSYSKIQESLVQSLELAQVPVAVCLAGALPQGVAMWSGTAPAGCRFWQEAAARTFATTARQHDLCAIGVYTHNLEATPASNADLNDALQVFGDLGYVRPEDVAQIPVLGERPRYVIYGPLAEAPAAPDVVLLFVDANQTLILAEAAQQVEAVRRPLWAGRRARSSRR